MHHSPLQQKGKQRAGLADLAAGRVRRIHEGAFFCSYSNDLKHTSSAWQHHVLGQCRLLNSMHVWGMLVSKGSQEDTSTPDKTGGRGGKKSAVAQDQHKLLSLCSCQCMHVDHGVSNCMLVHCRHLASQDKHKVKADDEGRLHAHRPDQQGGESRWRESRMHYFGSRN